MRGRPSLPQSHYGIPHSTLKTHGPSVVSDSLDIHHAEIWWQILNWEKRPGLKDILILKRTTSDTLSYEQMIMAERTSVHDIEKPAAPDHDDIKRKLTCETDPRVAAFSLQEQKKIYRRIDIRLVVTLGCMYMISLLDRTNLGAASVAG